MLNLVKYRKAFVLFSILIIVPGMIALGLWGLNVSIDFTTGSSVEFRPQNASINTEEQVREILKPLNLNDIQIFFGDSPGIDPAKMAWIDLNTAVDDNVKTAIQEKITTAYATENPDVQFKWATLSDKDGHQSSQLTISNFSTPPTAEELRATLTELPNTSDPTRDTPEASTTPTATAQTTATATATGTPQATPTATTPATTTPQATSTATPDAENPANTPVEVTNVQFGETNRTFEILVKGINISTTKGPGTDLTTGEIQSIFRQGGGPDLYLVSNNQVGAAVAGDTVRNSVLAVIAAAAFIMFYIWYAFRKVAQAVRYGVTAILAMIHDVLVVLGVFAVLGHFLNVQIDALFITALLTVIGFSVHDTIVVFDRVRENMQRRTVETFEEVVNASMLQTMARSLNTSLTVLFTLLPMTLFSNIGSSIHTFTLTLLIGVASGTFSSVFNASMLLVMWDNGEWFFKPFKKDDRDRPRRESREEREQSRELAKNRA